MLGPASAERRLVGIVKGFGAVEARRGVIMTADCEPDTGRVVRVPEGWRPT
jgi:hypothetical protein